MSALYPARVSHARLRPRAHRLRYRALYLLLDLDETPRLRLFSRGRFNLFSLDERDYGDGGRDLRGWVERTLAAEGIAAAGSRIVLLTMPRFLGRGFNPLSLYFCHAADGRLGAVLYEVNNTFGERHAYLAPISAAAAPPYRHACAKAFYVSPFMDMAQHYDFTLQPPAAALGLHIAVSDAQGLLMRATLAGRRVAATDAALLRAALAFPLLGLMVLGAIHWEALKLWLKGVGLRRRPPAPAALVSVIARERGP